MNNLTKYIKLIYLYPSLPILFNRLSNALNPIIVIGTPIHKNLGDHLIAQNEIEMLKDICGNNNPIVEIPTDVYFTCREKINRNIPNSSTIVISGGGWMGDIWPDDERRLQEIIKDHSSKKIIVFPQTIYYDNLNENKDLLDASIQAFRSVEHMYLFLRDKASYFFAKKYYESKNINVFLVPDIGLLDFKTNLNFTKKKNIILCLRDDREKIFNNEYIQIIEKVAKQRNYSISRMSTISKHSVPVWKRKVIIKKLRKQIAESELMITDRLHGMIFSYTSGTKCIAFDNLSKKVSGVQSKWLEDKSAVKVIENGLTNNEFEHIIDDFLSIEKSNWNHSSLTEGFKFFDKELRSILNETEKNDIGTYTK